MLLHFVLAILPTVSKVESLSQRGEYEGIKCKVRWVQDFFCCKEE